MYGVCCMVSGSSGTYLLVCVLKKFWCQVAGDGGIIAPLHVGAMYK